MELNETSVLAALDQIKRALIFLNQLPARSIYEEMAQDYDDSLRQMADRHRQRKGERDRLRVAFRKQLKGRSLSAAMSKLAKESQQDGIERRCLKQAKKDALVELEQEIAQADHRGQTLKRQYKSIARGWQAQMQADYFAEIGSGKRTIEPLPILYKDEWLTVVDKPAGLLSVPGRRAHLQDSVLSRLRYQLYQQSTAPFLQAVHRLDQDTSGVMVVAGSAEAHAALSRQFAERQVHKIYEAILSMPVDRSSGAIRLPLQADLNARPKQVVDLHRGKPSRTDYRIIVPGKCPRVEFVPRTGRTHQLRVHAAHKDGLNSPILGDALYGGVCSEDRMQKRLYLHAIALKLLHPDTHKTLHFHSEVPF